MELSRSADRGFWRTAVKQTTENTQLHSEEWQRLLRHWGGQGAFCVSGQAAQPQLLPRVTTDELCRGKGSACGAEFCANVKGICLVGALLPLISPETK